ncbi:MAG: 4-hydroxy-tetrahydrodipicolinate reductase [Fimbriimonadaceae bacterium]|nr:4-hydroxy-tetrahydrodipicolinate reductase [Fimbriimonadaceae bacterium]
MSSDAEFDLHGDDAAPRPPALRVGVVGAAGRMGAEIVRALHADAQFEVVAAVDRTGIGRPLADVIGGNVPELVISEKVGLALDACEADVIVDMSHASAVASHAQSAAKRGVSFVIGATGISHDDVCELEALTQSHGVAGMIVPNFAIGAVLMTRFAELAARWLPDAEIIEMHHERKEDAPSGTAMLTAELIAGARRSSPQPLPTPLLKAEGARGGTVHAVPVHSVRLPGLLAHQEVIFGGPGETLTIRHDSLTRESFMVGVKLCCRTVRQLSGLTIGMDKILFR